uniref:SFRICE_005302 n=1 Tax=Spodoptera frugiperda TaxID=7108 RepID=A0A2H1VNC3_SPOFR
MNYALRRCRMPVGLDISGCRWRLVVLRGGLRVRPLFSSGRLSADDDDDYHYSYLTFACSRIDTKLSGNIPRRPLSSPLHQPPVEFNDTHKDVVWFSKEMPEDPPPGQCSKTLS